MGAQEGSTNPDDPQANAFEGAGDPPAFQRSRDQTKRALDELFESARSYRGSADFSKLLEFVVRFRWYSPFNALLVHLQMTGARFVAPPSRWLREFGRRIIPGERPLVILQPRGPVMFVFDVSQTEPLDEAANLVPKQVLDPFAAGEVDITARLARTIENCARDGTAVRYIEMGSQASGQIQQVLAGGFLSFLEKVGPPPVYRRIAHTFDVQLNKRHKPATCYATLVHELAHLYCGHLGTPNPKWWPDRRGLAHDAEEFEAESVSYLVCRRSGIDTPSANYLSSFFSAHTDIPEISLDRVMAAAGLIESMGENRLPPRPAKRSQTRAR